MEHLPFHPYKSKSAGGYLSNRTPTPAELECGAELFKELRRLFPKSRIFAVGRQADQTMQKMGLNATHLPHPANGHANQFRAAVGEEIKSLNCEV